MAWLLIETPDGQRRQYKLGELDSGFGRAKANAVPLADQKCSSFHCLIKPQRGGRYAVIDAGSRNGTQVNEMPLEQGEERELVEGDVIAIGQTRIHYSEAEASPDKQAARILNPQETAAAIAAGQTAVLPAMAPSETASTEESAPQSASTDADASSTVEAELPPGASLARKVASPPLPSASSTESIPAADNLFSEAPSADRPAVSVLPRTSHPAPATLGATVTPSAGLIDQPSSTGRRVLPSLQFLVLSGLVALLSVFAYAAGLRHGADSSEASGGMSPSTRPAEQPQQPQMGATQQAVGDNHNGGGTVSASPPASSSQATTLEAQIAAMQREHEATRRLLARLEERQATKLAAQAELVDDLAKIIAGMNNQVGPGEEPVRSLDEELGEIHRLLATLHEHLELEFDAAEDSGGADEASAHTPTPRND